MATEFVGIELELMGADGVRRDLESIDRLLNSFRGRKKFDAGFAEARRQVVEYKGELEKLKREQDKYTKGSDDWNRVASEIDDVRQKLWNAQQAVREFGLASRQAGKTFMQTFNSISSKVAHVGSALQSFGNAMTNLTSPFSRLTDGILLGAGYKALNSFTSGLESGFSRYDTMKKFPKIMTALGYGAEEADAAIAKLDASVQGLPIALDDAVSMAQRYIATTGDINKGTDIAIAANNAFLASMSTEQQRYQGMMQLQDVLGGKDMNAREWYSLANSMMPAIRQMGKYLGYTGAELDEYVSKVSQGKIANEEFIKTLIAAGTDENGTIYKMAQEAKDTYEALFSRIGTAASRMVYGVIKSLDEISQTVTGMDVNQLLDTKIIPSIDKATESVKAWIKAHPEEITNFFKGLKDIKIGSFIKSYAKSLGLMVDLFSKVAKIGNGKGFMSFMGWVMGLGRGIGKASTILGGFLKGTRHIWAFLFTFAKFGGKRLFGGMGIFGKIASIFGKKKDIDAVGDAAKAVPSVSSTFKSAFASLEGVMKAAGAVVLVSGAGFVAFKSVRSILKDLSAISEELKGMTWLDAVHGANIIMGIGVMIKIFEYVGTALGTQGLLGVAIASAASMLVTGSLWADTELIKQGLRNINDTIKEIDNIANSINGMQGFTSLGADAKQKISDSIDTIREVANLLVGKNGGPSSRGEYSQGLPMFVGLRANGVKSIAQAIRSMQDIVTNINKLSTMTINAEGVNSKLDEIGKVIDQVFKALPRLVRGTSGASNLNKSASNFANALIGIRRMAYHINKLAGTDVNTEGFGVFVQNLKVALAKLKALGEDISLDIEVKLAPGFNRSVKTVITKINNARRDIQNAINKIPSTYTKNVTIRINANVLSAGVSGIASVGANIVSGIANSVHPAMGGYIYRARGGSVGHPGRPRGSDKIPAWLSAGEYVQNKRAVDTFGIDFMRKVNNLDVKGAMNELMHRAGGMANINRGTVINNNTYNNQKVNITNNGSVGAGFTFKSASRFVGAF